MGITNNSPAAKDKFRQGDVLIIRSDLVDDQQLKDKAIAQTNFVTLALGEATGHHHSVLDPIGAVGYAERPDALARVVKTNRPVSVQHQEHEVIPLRPNKEFFTYRQVEYTPQALRNVRD